MQDFMPKALGPVKKGLLASIGVGFFINLLMLASPLYMLQIYDRVLTSRSMDTLLLLTLIVIAALFVYGLLEVVRGQLMRALGDWINGRLSSLALNQALQRTVHMQQSANVQALRDLDTLRGFLSSPSLISVCDAPWATIFLAVIFLLHPMLGWIALAGALVLLLLALCSDRLARPLQQEASITQLSALAQADAAIKNAELVEAMGLGPKITERWDRANAASVQQQALAAGRSNVFATCAKVLRMSLQVAIMGCGAWLTIAGELSAGGIIAASILVSRALAPVDQAMSTWRSASLAREAYQRLDSHFSDFELPATSMPLPSPTGKLSIEGLSFTYPGQESPSLNDLSFSLNAGESLALMGPSGSGKTTLARLILGNLHPSSGHARLDGMDMAQWPSPDRGQYIGYLPQDIELFAGSIHENISRLAEGCADEVIAAAKLADVHELIMRQPQGYDTRIGDNGMSLSGGQRQRIALARALYSQPKLIILDEPNANLDKAGELALQHTLSELKRQAITTIIISHRSNILKQMDKILILQEGQRKAFGSADELIKPHAANAPSSKKKGSGIATSYSYRVK